jgi:hypothetical protein
VKVASWEYYRLDPRRIVPLACFLGFAGGVAVYYLTSGILGNGAIELCVVIAVVLSYLTLSFPKRLMDSASLSQSREAPVLAVMGSANAEATRSKTRTMLFLTSGELTIATALAGIRRSILLGFTPASAVSQVEADIASYSVKNLLELLATRPSEVPEEGEESQGITRSSQLGEESKLPLFTAIAFFTPIMLLLFVIFSHASDPVSLGEVVALEVVLLDVGLYFSSTERRRLG